MDFSSIPYLETILGYTIGGVSIGAILLVVYKIIRWLKKNNLATAVERLSQLIIGKDINIDLTVIAEKKLSDIYNALIGIATRQEDKIKAQSIVLADMADIISNSKLASEEQKKALQSHTDIIRVYEAVKPKETIKVKLEPIKVTEEKQTAEFLPEEL